MHALTFSRFGGPEVLDYRELPDPVAGPGEMVVALEAAGLNFADIYRRRGHYHLAGQAPWIAGYEGAGRIVALGSGVKGFAIGEHIGFADVPFANATRVAVPADHAIRLPDRLSAVEAAAILLQGLTALYLIEDSAEVRPGQTVLIHAAAGGVGQILVRLARARGAVVHAVASTPEKRAVALDCGAHHAHGADWAGAVGDIDVVFDSIGSTLGDSLRVVRPRGRVVFFGTAGGEPPMIDPRVLMDGSKAVIGGDLWSYLDSGAARATRAARLFAALETGEMRLPPIETFALADGAAAHARLESRAVAGKIVLVP